MDDKLNTLKANFSMLGAALVFVASCGVPTPTQEELDLTITAKDANYNFSVVKTYFLPSTVVVIQDPSTTTSYTLSSSLNDFTINQVATHFNNAGYSRLTDKNGPKPDFFVEVSTMRSTNTEVYYSYWSTYWGGYYAPWYSYGVGYAPVPYSYVINSTVGSLIVNMTNPNQPNPTTNQIPTAWVTVLNGIIDGSPEAQIQARIESGLDEAFSLSPYLKAGSQ